MEPVQSQRHQWTEALDKSKDQTGKRSVGFLLEKVWE
jgi:hypothetical protein